MSRRSNYAKQDFFRISRARADAFQKRKAEIARMKSGEVVEDPKQVVEMSDEVVPDPVEVVEE